MRAQAIVLRHEHMADRVVAGFRQRNAKGFGFCAQKFMRHLDQNTGAVARQRVSADRAAMFEVFENAQRIFNDLVRALAFEIGDETDAACITLVARIIQSLRTRQPGAVEGFIVQGWQVAFAHVLNLRCAAARVSQWVKRQALAARAAAPRTSNA